MSEIELNIDNEVLNDNQNDNQTGKENSLKNKINEAIQEFYKLKNAYESNYQEKYVSPILKLKGLSIKEKRNKFRKLPKPKCINCKRNVGTIFSIKGSNNFTNHTYTSYCGDITDPCPLNIKIVMPNVQLINDILYENESSLGTINQIRIKIIKAKNDLLFGYMKQENAFNEFEELTNSLEQETKAYEIFLEKFIMVYDNPIKKENLKKEKVELGLNIQEFKNMISEFNKTNNQQIVYNAVEMFLNEIDPKLKKIEKMTYGYNKVEYNEDSDIYFLIQKKYTLDQVEFEYENPKIESFIKGTLNNKTLKQTRNVSSQGTRKQRTKTKPKIELVLQEEADEEEQEQEQEGQEEQEQEQEQEEKE